jgi:hypothetical protein
MSGFRRQPLRYRQFRAHRRVLIIRTAARDVVVRWRCGPLDGDREEDGNFMGVRDSRCVEVPDQARRAALLIQSTGRGISCCAVARRSRDGL